MSDKKMKALLKNAYQITPSEREKAFLRKNEKRSMRLWDIFSLELKYMRVQSLLSVAILLVVFYLILISDNPHFMWTVSGMLPVIALIMTAGLGKSERYGMLELESASRFSLRFIKTIRMSILGAVSLVLIAVISIVSRGKLEYSFVKTIGLIGAPYMLNIWCNLVITRKWHTRENLVGCVGTTALTCLLPVLLEKVATFRMFEPVLAVFFIGLCILTVRESFLYIREREELLWNYC